MKDKIYVDKYDHVIEGFIPEGAPVAEYIRKDALLEWANDSLLECEISKDETDYGRIDAYRKLIERIDTL